MKYEHMQLQLLGVWSWLEITVLPPVTEIMKPASLTAIKDSILPEPSTKSCSIYMLKWICKHLIINEAGTRWWTRKIRTFLCFEPGSTRGSELDGNFCERVRLYFRVPVAMVVEAPPSILAPSCSVTQKRIWRKATQPSHLAGISLFIYR